MRESSRTGQSRAPVVLQMVRVLMHPVAKSDVLTVQLTGNAESLKDSIFCSLPKQSI